MIRRILLKIIIIFLRIYLSIACQMKIEDKLGWKWKKKRKGKINVVEVLGFIITVLGIIFIFFK